MSPPRRDHVRQAIEILQSCCLYQDEEEQKMRKKVADIEKLYEISLLKQNKEVLYKKEVLYLNSLEQKQQSLITDFFQIVRLAI